MRALDGVRVGVTASRRATDQIALLRRRGADVLWAPVFPGATSGPDGESGRSLEQVRVATAGSSGGALDLVRAVARFEVDAVTFTAVRAVTSFLAVAGAHGLEAEVRDALRGRVLALSIGPVTGAALLDAGIPTTWPEQARLEAMLTHLGGELPARQVGVTLRVAGGRELRLGQDGVLLDGEEVRLTPAPAAVLRVLAERPGRVVSRPVLLAALPSGNAGTEHAVEMAVARLRQVVGAPVVQTAIKRGYRLAVS